MLLWDVFCGASYWDMVSFIVHNSSMLIHHIWADLCLYSYKRSTKKPCYCETYFILWSKWLRLGEFHCILTLHNWSILILPSINIWADLCFYSYKRSTKEPCYCEMYSARNWDFVSFIVHYYHQSTSELTIVSICIGVRLRNHATVRRILWSK